MALEKLTPPKHAHAGMACECRFERKVGPDFHAFAQAAQQLGNSYGAAIKTLIAEKMAINQKLKTPSPDILDEVATLDTQQVEAYFDCFSNKGGLTEAYTALGKALLPTPFKDTSPPSAQQYLDNILKNVDAAWEKHSTQQMQAFQGMGCF